MHTASLPWEAFSGHAASLRAYPLHLRRPMLYPNELQALFTTKALSSKDLFLEWLHFLRTSLYYFSHSFLCTRPPFHGRRSAGTQLRCALIRFTLEGRCSIQMSYRRFLQQRLSQAKISFLSGCISSVLPCTTLVILFYAHGLPSMGGVQRARSFAARL